MNGTNIWLIHPALQPYREELFKLLDINLGVHFIFVGWQSHNQKLLPASGLRKWEALPARALGPYRGGVSSALLKAALMGDYKIWVTSALNWFPTHIGFLIVRARKKRFVVWSEDWWWAPGLEGKLARAYGRRIFKLADALICAGTKTLEFAIQNGANPRSTFLAPNSTLDLSLRRYSDQDVAEVRRRYVPDDGAFVFLYLNRLVDYKGLDVLLRAFAKIQNENAYAWLLVVGDGPLAGEYKQLAAKLKIQRITFAGKIDHDSIHLIYRACRVYVHPAKFVNARVRAEAWGFTINEAMSLGVPVIATTAVGAAFDLIQDGANGHLVAAGDERALANRMLQVLQQPDDLWRMSLAAKEAARAFSATRQFKGFAAAIRCAEVGQE